MKWDKLLCAQRIRSHQHTDIRELRSEFEKDYHRIIGSASFRRLQDKTQVFPLDASDFVRTRLTHSLEVSSLARSLGQNVSERIIAGKLDSDFRPEYKAHICDILQCSGLIHDIGNPPFGHFGETTIREWFIKHLPELTLRGKPLNELLTDQMKNDFYHFEGNAQAFRLVTKLHFLVDRNGMNLTKALLSAVIKYPVSSLEIDPGSGDIRTKKMGYFYADRETFVEVEESTGTNGARHPLSFLLEAADDIAYITADIEDAYKKKYLSYEKLTQELMLYLKNHSFDQKMRAEYLDSLKSLQKKYEHAREMDLKDPGEYAVQNWVVSVQRTAINAATDQFIAHYDEIMSGSYHEDLLTGSVAQTIMNALGDIELRYVFRSEPIYKHEIAEEVIIDFLLDKFIDAAIVFDTDETPTAVQKRLMGIISENYMSVYQITSEGRPENEKLYLRLLLVTDYICGMTDGFAKSLYQELSGW